MNHQKSVCSHCHNVMLIVNQMTLDCQVHKDSLIQENGIQEDEIIDRGNPTSTKISYQLYYRDCNILLLLPIIFKECLTFD